MHTVRRQRDVRATAKGVRWHAYLGHAHTRLPLSSATWAHFCISRNRPRAVANRRQWAGGPPTADLSNYTRRAGRRRPAPPGPMRCRGAQGICPLPGPAQRPAGLAAQWQLSCSRPSALRAARNQRRAGGRVQARRIGLAMGDCAHVPARRILPVCYRSTDCTAKHDNCAGALASRSRGKLWPHLRSTIAPWGFLRVRL
jgi:hypothetical protein